MVRDGVPQRYCQVVLAGYAIKQRSVSGVGSVCLPLNRRILLKLFPTIGKLVVKLLNFHPEMLVSVLRIRIKDPKNPKKMVADS